MKSFTLLLLFIAITLTGMTQVQKGSFLIGGNISFESIKSESSSFAGYKTTNLFISPNIGYFIVEKLAGGVRLDSRSYKQTSPNNLHHIFFSISPFIRYYILPANKKINALLDMGYLNYTSKVRNGSSFTQKFNGYTISGGPVMFLSNHVALEFIIGYRHTIEKNTSNTETRLNTGLGLQIHLGKIRSKGK